MSRWRTILAVDFDRWACETYRANFPGVDVRHAKVADVLDDIHDCDVLLGGPPCQPFSDAGENEGEADGRDCIPDFIAAVERKRPRQFLMENVRGLLKEKHLAYFGRVLTQLESLGYVVDWRVLDAVSFGVPQFRERVWVWGIRADINLKHQWPQPTHAWPPPDECMFGAALLPGVTVGESLGLNGAIRRNHGSEKVTVQAHVGHDGDAWDEREITDEPSVCVTGQGSDSQPRIHEYRWSDAMLEKHPPASPAPTVQAKWFKGGAEGLVEATHFDNHAFLEMDQPAAPQRVKPGSTTYVRIDGERQHGSKLRVRRLTPLECLRLQSGPDDFAWPKGITKTAMYRVVGNGWASRMGDVFARAFALVDPESSTVVDLFCGGGLGACGWHGRYWAASPPRVGAAERGAEG